MSGARPSGASSNGMITSATTSTAAAQIIVFSLAVLGFISAPPPARFLCRVPAAELGEAAQGKSPGNTVSWIFPGPHQSQG